MTFIDWLIILLPLGFVYYMGFKSRNYIHDVADFLAAGRICGRYVISVADTATALSVIGLVAYVEVQYKTGFALAFWNNLLLPALIIMGLTGYCTYRYRETRALSIGQFLEMRYSRGLRIFAAFLRTVSEILANAILPAIAARFFICILGLPRHFELFGMQIETYPCLMAFLIFMALSIIWLGGALALIVTDAIQGMFCFPLMVVFAIFVLCRFSWSTEIIPVMMDRVPGESFLNPFDISSLRDFNAFALALGIFAAVFHRGSWIGSGSSTAARNPHEQKMAGLLGMWRSSLATVFFVLIAIAILTILNHRNFAEDAHEIRLEISRSAAENVIQEKQIRGKVISAAEKIPVIVHRIGEDAPRSENSTADTVYLDRVHQTLAEETEGNLIFQKFRTLYYQLMLPACMRKMLPAGLLGAFCLLIVLAMISTDDSRIFSSAQTIAQDIILVIRQKPFSVKEHVLTVKLTSLGVGVVFFIGSYFMAQLDYIQLFITLATMMWLCGCGPVIIFGFYSRFGTVAGAWTSLVSGMVWALGSLFVQRNWADVVYPFLEQNGWTEQVGRLLEVISRPLNPYVVWKMDAVKCPVNSYELYFIGMMLTLALYCIVSRLTMKEPFNLEKMLHRGAYALASDSVPEVRSSGKSSWWSKIIGYLVGITPQYSCFDKVIAWGLFGFSIIYTFLLSFLLVAVWNVFSPWPVQWWGNYFLVVSVIVPGILAAVTAVWFIWGGVRDMRQMFVDLKDRVRDEADNGRVIK